MARRDIPETFIIPVETLNREFDGKLLLALHAAARGLKPIIGGRTLINAVLPSLPRSIYLAKGIRAHNGVVFAILEGLGHRIVALDEEALLPFPETALLAMYDGKVFNRPRLLYAWGRRNAELWRRYPHYAGAPILEAGNPRADMLRPEVRGYFASQAETLARRFGDFVLFSSNFSFVNHFIPNYKRFRLAKGVDTEGALAVRSAYDAHKQALFDRFKEAIPAIAKAIAPANLVIRPHPSERAATWSEAAASLDNVHVLHEGPATPWLMAARALLHNGCTTAVEAAQLGTPAFAYRPVRSDEIDTTLPNDVSIECRSLKDLTAALQQALAAGSSGFALGAAQRYALLEHIASAEGPLCVERIVTSVTEPSPALDAPPPSGSIERLAAYANFAARTAARAVRSRIKTNRTSSAYLSHKFPGIAEREVNARIARFRAVQPHLPDVQAREMRPGIFAIGKA